MWRGEGRGRRRREGKTEDKTWENSNISGERGDLGKPSGKQSKSNKRSGGPAQRIA